MAEYSRRGIGLDLPDPTAQREQKRAPLSEAALALQEGNARKARLSAATRPLPPNMVPLPFVVSPDQTSGVLQDPETTMDKDEQLTWIQKVTAFILQMVSARSNISKKTHDTAMTIIGNTKA